MTDSEAVASGPDAGGETAGDATRAPFEPSPEAPPSSAPEASRALEPANMLEPAGIAEPTAAGASNTAEELAALLARSAREVSGYLDALAHRIGELDSGRADRSELARQIETFARQYHDRFPEVAAIADRLAKLLRHQAHLVERLQWASELLIAGSGRLADKLAPPDEGRQVPSPGEGVEPPERTARR